MQFGILATERLVGQHLLEGHGDELAHIGPLQHRRELLGDFQRRGRSRRDQDQTDQALGAARCHELGRFAAHGVADEDVALQAESLDGACGIVGEIRNAKATAGMLG